MANTRHRLERLEKLVGGQSRLHFVVVIAKDDENYDQALERVLGEEGITREKLGQVLFFQRGLGLRTINYGHFGSVRDLSGHDDLWARFFDGIKTRC